MRFLVIRVLPRYITATRSETLIAIAIFGFMVLPAIALSQLALSVRRERLSRPPQTSVPVVVGMNYKTAQIKLRDANLTIRVLANRHDPNLESGLIIAQVQGFTMVKNSNGLVVVYLAWMVF